jgi:soluble lytic murein transglycosylase-like protein
MPLRRLGLIAAVLSLVGSAVPASAELVYLTSGRTMSVKGHAYQGDLVVLQLRGGGEARFERSLVDRIEPDEVPYQEPGQKKGQSPFPMDGDGNGDSPLNGDSPFAELIDSLSTAHGIDPGLVKAVIKVESGYRVKARSRKGAMGLMQIMPDTARQYSVKNPYDPKANLEAGITHLASLLRRFEVSVALAAYNAGEAAVKRFGGIPPYPETRDYVRRIMALASPR